MNLLQLAPFWLIALLAALLVAAAVEDLHRLRISNLTVAAVIAAAVVAAVLAGPSIALWKNLVVFALILAGGTLLFSTGKVGGGDVKLFGAVGLWTDLQQAFWLVAAVFIAGGLLALVMIAARMLGLRSKRASRDSKSGVPYAVAIAAGALLVIGWQRQAPDLPQSNPLEFRAR